VVWTIYLEEICPLSCAARYAAMSYCRPLVGVLARTRYPVPSAVPLTALISTIGKNYFDSLMILTSLMAKARQTSLKSTKHLVDYRLSPEGVELPQFETSGVALSESR
jgi:hypothetical protein